MVHSKNKPINKKEDNKGKKDEEEVEIKKDKIKKCKEKKEESSDDDDNNNDEMTKITDNYIFEAFMNCLKMVVCDKELPMDPSVLWNHMLGCKNQKISLDIKNSSYKKIGKFL
jgi:translation initiation factor 2D